MPCLHALELLLLNVTLLEQTCTQRDYKRNVKRTQIYFMTRCKMSLPRIQTIAVGAVPTLIDPLMGIANKTSKKKKKKKKYIIALQ